MAWSKAAESRRSPEDARLSIEGSTLGGELRVDAIKKPDIASSKRDDSFHNGHTRFLLRRIRLYSDVQIFFSFFHVCLPLRDQAHLRPIRLAKVGLKYRLSNGSSNESHNRYRLVFFEHVHLQLWRRKQRKLLFSCVFYLRILFSPLYVRSVGKMTADYSLTK